MNGTVCAMEHVSLCDAIKTDAIPYDHTWIIAIVCSIAIVAVLGIKVHNPKHILPVVHKQVPPRHI